MSVFDLFKSEASWREKATALASKVAETVAARENLEQDAATRALAAGLDDKDIVRIERDIQELAARERWLRRALDEAEAKAAAERRRQEAERRRQEAEARRRRIAELRARHEANAGRIAPAARAFIEAANAYAASAAALAEEIDDKRASMGPRTETARLLGIEALRYRVAMTQWRVLRNWISYEAGVVPEINRDLAELEREVVASLVDGGDKRGASTNDDAPEAA
jgi:hypothetical protein